jgi:hypothetical protein
METRGQMLRLKSKRLDMGSSDEDVDVEMAGKNNRFALVHTDSTMKLKGEVQLTSSPNILHTESPPNERRITDEDMTSAYILEYSHDVKRNGTTNTSLNILWKRLVEFLICSGSAFARFSGTFDRFIRRLSIHWPRTCGALAVFLFCVIPLLITTGLMLPATLSGDVASRFSHNLTSPICDCSDSYELTCASTPSPQHRSTSGGAILVS